MCFVVILYSIFGINVLTDCMCIQVHVDVDLCTSFISTYMYIFTDCYDYGITITGATDTRIEDAEPVLYTFFDEVPVATVRRHTCTVVEESFVWRHIR